MLIRKSAEEIVLKVFGKRVTPLKELIRMIRWREEKDLCRTLKSIQISKVSGQLLRAETKLEQAPIL